MCWITPNVEVSHTRLTPTPQFHGCFGYRYASLLEGNFLFNDFTCELPSKTEVVFFVGYPKGAVEGLFYSHKANKVFVSTNAKLLENDYMNDYTPRS